MPIGPTGQEFWPKYNFCVLPLKLVDSIFIVPRNKWKNLLREKKNYVEFFSKMPHDSTGQNFSFFFFLKYNVEFFARKILDHIYSGQRNKWKNIMQEKKSQLNIGRKCSKIILAQNFDWNTMSALLYENF